MWRNLRAARVNLRHPTMPVLLLLLMALAAGVLVALAFDRFAPAKGATAAAADAVEAAVESSGLAAVVARAHGSGVSSPASR